VFGARRSHWLSAGVIVPLLKTACLWAFADPTVWYFVQVAAHPLLALMLTDDKSIKWRCRLDPSACLTT